MIDSSVDGRRRDFWIFFGGQTLSNLGSSVTLFALPLLVFKLTGSAMNLAITTAATFLPYLLFGLAIGAWVDRVDRRRLMIAVDVGRAAALGLIPLLAVTDQLHVWHVYIVAFVQSTMTICFDSAQFAAIPSLVDADDLVAANGRIQASYSTAAVAGPPLAGLLVATTSTETAFLLDAATFVVSAVSLALIRRRFNLGEKAVTRIRRDIAEGIRYVLGHPVLRNISLMMALVNFVGTTAFAQIVLFAKDHYEASDTEVSLLFSGGSAGVIVLSLAAGPLRKRFAFGPVALGALTLDGLMMVLLAVSSSFWIGLALWSISSGLGVLFNVTTGSLRQTIVPNELLGRVGSVAAVLAFAAIPLGTITGGWLIEATDDVAAVYAGIGIAIAVIAVAFAFTPLGRAEQYLADSTGDAFGNAARRPPNPEKAATKA